MPRRLIYRDAREERVLVDNTTDDYSKCKIFSLCLVEYFLMLIRT